jgi:hypothetical protein
MSNLTTAKNSKLALLCADQGGIHQLEEDHTSWVSDLVVPPCLHATLAQSTTSLRREAWLRLPGHPVHATLLTLYKPPGILQLQLTSSQ